MPERIDLEMEIDLVVAICFLFEDLEVAFVEEDCLAFDGLVFALFAFFSEVFVEIGSSTSQPCRGLAIAVQHRVHLMVNLISGRAIIVRKWDWC